MFLKRYVISFSFSTKRLLRRNLFVWSDVLDRGGHLFPLFRAPVNQTQYRSMGRELHLAVTAIEDRDFGRDLSAKVQLTKTGLTKQMPPLPIR